MTVVTSAMWDGWHLTLRATTWRPVLVGGAGGLVLAGAERAADRPVSPLTLLTTLILLSALSACVVDDPAENTLAASPTSTRRRAARRGGVALGVVAVSWLPLAALSPSAASAPTVVGLLAMTVSATAVGVCAASRTDLTRPSVVGTTLPILVALAASASAPGRHLLPDIALEGAAWPWGTIVLAATTVALAVWATRDRASRAERVVVAATEAVRRSV